MWRGNADLDCGWQAIAQSPTLMLKWRAVSLLCSFGVSGTTDDEAMMIIRFSDPVSERR